MRVVLDANVLFSAFASHGACDDLFENVVDRDTLLCSADVLEDVRSKLIEKAGASAAEGDAVVRLVRSVAEMIDPPALEQRVCHDPDDDHVLSLAAASHADCVVTGDKDLLVLNEYEGIPILRVRDFWSWAGHRRSERP